MLEQKQIWPDSDYFWSRYELKNVSFGHRPLQHRTIDIFRGAEKYLIRSI